MPQWQQILSAITGIAFLVIRLSVAIFILEPTDCAVRWHSFITSS